MQVSLLTLFLVIGICGGLVAGCGRKTPDVAGKTTVALSDIGNYKTPKGKAVRVFKVTVEYGMKRENLLMVVGDANAPVAMPNAVTVTVGGKTGSVPVFASPAGNAVVAVGVEDPSKPIDIRLDITATMPEESMSPASQGPSTTAAFPIPAMKAKIRGEILSLPELDTL